MTSERRQPSRRVIGGLALVAFMALLMLENAVTVHAAGPCGPPVVNPVACENTNPGTPPSVWDISGSGDSSIQGFATDISVNKGGTISFKINTPASAYTITIYRIGYYQGNGARQIATVAPAATLPQRQPGCLTNTPTGLVDCGNWAVSASWAVPSTAVSGIYFAKLVRTDTGGSSHIMFVVRDDAGTSDLLFQASDTTWQAYNQYGGNSLYLGTAPSDDGRAYKVSYNRPFATRGQTPGYGTSNWVFYGEYPMIRFLEANGYDVSYFTDTDSDRRGSLIKSHKAFLSVGHDEYWSAGQRANVEAARAAGVSLAFFSGNESFWKVRWENSIDGSGTPFRTLVSYKETKSEAQIDPQDPPTWTGTWRDPTLSPPGDGGRPENAVTGTIFMVNRGSAAITVPAAYSKLHFWRNTAIALLGAGQTATLGTQTLGYEWDEDLDNGFRPAGLFDLSSTTVSVPELLQDYGNTYSAGTAVHHLTLYRAGGGGLVFGGGTVQWSWGLDVNHDVLPDFGPSTPDPNMRQATVNVLADMGAQPATLQSGLVAGSPSTDAVAPTSSITAPAPGTSVAMGSTVTVTGTAVDAGGGVVAGVEVSVDGGVSWHPATGVGQWSFSWKAARPGPVTILSRAVDDSGNLETPGPGVAMTVAGPTQPTFLSTSNARQFPSVTPPAGIVPGDLLLASLEIDADPVTVTGAPGWTLIQDTTAGKGTGTAFHAQLWYKIATNHEPLAYVWAVSGNPYVDVAVSDYYNINKTSPIDVSAGRDSGVTRTPTTPSITTTTPGDMIVATFIDFNNVTWTAGSGMTKRYDFDGNTGQDAVQAAAGASGTKTATNNDTFSGNTSAQIVALRPLQADTVAPAVTLTAPAAGATVSGSVSLQASASDNVGVAYVQFQVDGVNVGGRVTAAPYQVSWDSTQVGNGSHVLSAQAADAAGNVGTSVGVTVTVSNAPPPVISGVQATGIGTNVATVSWSTDVGSSSQVEYGLTAAYGQSSVLDPTLVTTHAVGLTGLQPGTQYHYRVKSGAGGSLGVSGDFTFTTGSAPPAVPVFRSQSTVTNGTTVSKPAGVVAGDLLLATLEVDEDPAPVSGPAGWTLLLDTVAAQGTGSAYHAQVWYRVAGASEPSSYTWTVSGSPWVDVGVLAYSNVNQASPIDVSSGRYVGVTASPSTDAVTTTGTNEMLVALFINYNSGTWTAGSGMTQRYNFDSNEAQDALQASAGSTGARTATNSTSGPTTAQIVVLRGP